MQLLTHLAQKSIYIIREAQAQFKRAAVLWSMGKDSTALLRLIREAFDGKIPFPVIHIDTGFKFPQMYKFRDELAKKLKLELIIAANAPALRRGMNPESRGHLACCTQLKTEALRMCIDKHKFDALLLAIRRDEHGIRAKERYFSPRDKKFGWDYRNQPPEFWELYQAQFGKDTHHYRVHPLLHWTELDIWKYIKKEKITVNPLYFAKNGRRFRSLGCMPCTVPIASKANTIDKIIRELKTTVIAERSGRTQDKEKEYMMQKLRSLGYM